MSGLIAITVLVLGGGAVLVVVFRRPLTRAVRGAFGDGAHVFGDGAAGAAWAV